MRNALLLVLFLSAIQAKASAPPDTGKSDLGLNITAFYTGSAQMEGFTWNPNLTVHIRKNHFSFGPTFVNRLGGSFVVNGHVHQGSYFSGILASYSRDIPQDFENFLIQLHYDLLVQHSVAYSLNEFKHRDSAHITNSIQQTFGYGFKWFLNEVVYLNHSLGFGITTYLTDKVDLSNNEHHPDKNYDLSGILKLGIGYEFR